MGDAKTEEVMQWMLKAQHDVASARVLLACSPKILDTAVYHCQQAVEKVLKAYLTLQECQFMKTHDLTVLVAQCMRMDVSFDVLENMAEILTPYATAFRYPGDVLEPDPVDAEEALALAEKALVLILGKLPEEVRCRL